MFVPKKIVNPIAGRFDIAEDYEYKLSLTRVIGKDGKRDVVRLYRVSAKDGSMERYVLAPDEDGAISQVLCCAADSSKREDTVSVRVPFRIRGWSDNEF